jgi:hypothetical protein
MVEAVIPPVGGPVSAIEMSDVLDVVEGGEVIINYVAVIEVLPADGGPPELRLNTTSTLSGWSADGMLNWAHDRVLNYDPEDY